MCASQRCRFSDLNAAMKNRYQTFFLFRHGGETSSPFLQKDKILRLTVVKSTTNKIAFHVHYNRIRCWFKPAGDLAIVEIES